MKIILRAHLKIRLKERKIPLKYPRTILNSSNNLYFDKITNHYIAIKSLKYNQKIRPMVLVYDIIDEEIQVITVYPTNQKEISNRVKNQRWVKYEKN